MIASMGLLAAVLAAAAPADSPRQAEAGPRIAYRFQTVAVEGLSWREAALKPVAQHGSISVWTAPDDFLDRVAGSASKIDEATEAEGPAGAPVHVSARTPRSFVTRIVSRGKAKAPRQVVEQVREGLTATVAGRKIDQGVLARIVVEDVDVRAVHVRAVASGSSASRTAAAATSLPAKVETKRAESGSVTVTVTAAMNGETDAPAPPADEPSECKTEEGAVQIPEVGRAAAAGEWLIPEGEVLIVGFGPHTVADDAGRAVVRERLAVIAAEAGEDEPTPSNLTAVEIPAPVVPPAAIPAPAPVRADAPRIATDLPELPKRTLPQPVHPDGTPAPEPNVPEDAAHAAAAAGESTQPLPTPQTRGKKLLPKAAEAAPPPPPAAVPSQPEKNEAPKTEPNVIKSSFTLPALQRIQGLDTLGRLITVRSLGVPFRGLEFLMPLKPLALKLPFQHKLEFELIGRVVPDRSDDDRIVVRD